ncbi:MAG: ATP-binding cassette domain-containing protein [Flavobacterium sp.]
MNTYEFQHKGVLEALELKEFNYVIKRIIDFTLDTESINFYKKTISFLDWYDFNLEKVEELKSKLSKLLADLYHYLSKKVQVKNEELINIKSLEKAFKEFKLGPINLSINTSDIIGLVGENGNGKTTLLRSIAREVAPSLGEIYYLFNYSSSYDLRTKLVYLPQQSTPWKGSILENLMFTASCYKYKKEEISSIVNLVIARFDLRKYKNQAWSNLSSGYKMRFELARMLLRKPKILLMDEPLANLDILAQQSILDDFKNIANSPFRPIAIVLSSQQLYEVEKASNQIIFLKKGRQYNLKDRASLSQQFIVEFETDENFISLKEKLAIIKLISLERNGGTLIATFPIEIDLSSFMTTLINKEIQIKYLRDISNSARVLFI